MVFKRPIIIAFSVLIPVVVLAAGEWPMFQHDAQHTGFSPDSVYPPFDVRWTQTGGGKGCLAGGRLFVITNDDEVSALDAQDGRVLWRRNTGTDIRATSTDGEVLFVGAIWWPNWPSFFAFDAWTGRTLWTCTTGTVNAGPVVHDGVVYFTNGSFGGKTSVRAAEARTGRLLWQFSVPVSFPYGGFWFAPAYWNGRVYAATDSGMVYALNGSTGDTLWSFPSIGWFNSGPAVANGLVYFCSNGVLIALDAVTGAIRWGERLGYWGLGSIPTTPAIYESLVYACGVQVGAQGPVDTLYCLNALTGKRIWTRGSEYAGWVSPVVSGNGLLFIGVEDTLWTLKAETGEVLDKHVFGDSGYISDGWPMISGNMVYVASGRLYALDGQIPPGRSIGDLFKVYPNPFREHTTFDYQLSGRARVSVTLYDVLGRQVKVLEEGEKYPGRHVLVWDGTSDRGWEAPAGVYICRFELNGKLSYRQTVRLVHLR